MNAFEIILENKLLELHTAFMAKVISTAPVRVQPLHMAKQVGKTAQKRAVISNVPVLRHVGSLKAGDTVFCVCAERDITETRRGAFAVPARGRHQLQDAVIVGVLA